MNDYSTSDENDTEHFSPELGRIAQELNEYMNHWDLHPIQWAIFSRCPRFIQKRWPGIPK